jgi:DNA-binding beta-propeller fold protein YncE
MRAAGSTISIACASSVIGALLGAAPFGCKGSSDGGGSDAGPTIYETVDDIPAAQRRDVASSSMVWDDARGRALVATGDGGALVRIDPNAPTGKETVTLGADLRSVALSPDGLRIVVVDRGTQGADPQPGSVTMLDAQSLAVLWTQPLDGRPRAAIFDPAHPRWIYVAVEDAGAVSVLDRSTHTIAGSITVGRLPSGLAASGARDELVVTRRIDGVLHVVDRTNRTELAQIALADSPANTDVKVAQGKPYAFESMAWAPDGVHAWVPHQTYDGAVAPLQFQSVVFPAVSVVDFSARAEVTNDGSDGKHFPGRKELFKAIDVISGSGDAQIVSGPCAAAFHPTGPRAYVLACASDDLIVFDTDTGTAKEILKVPGDHANAIAIDRAGSKAYLVSDQSKSLTVVDLAGGSPIAHPSIVGDAVPLLDHDPVAPEMRRALTLFHRADHHQTFPDDDGTPLALSGQSWMACASCHLDGLTTTNAFLFEASPRVQPGAAKDALMGHRGLKDFFSTAANPDDPSFDPHDVMIALLDMGGLAPDTTGKDRTGAADPSHPTTAVTNVARDLARIVHRDMPQAPSWLLQAPADASVSPQYSTQADAAWCGTCHKEQYDAWRKSAHSHAAEDPFVSFSANLEQSRGGDTSIRHCFGCHDPNGLRLGNPSLTKGQGVTCTSCHDVRSLIQAGGNADVRSKPRDWSQDHKEAASAQLPLLRTPEFCAGCHQSFVPGNGLLFIDTLSEWKASPYPSKGIVCQTCHLPKLDDGAHDHSFPGGNVTLATIFSDDAMRTALETNLKSAAGITAKKDASGVVTVTVQASGVGHLLPTGVADVRELWIEVVGLDGSGAALARVGAPASDTGLIDDSGPRLGLDLADVDGKILRLHELGLAVAIPFDRRAAPVQKTPLTIDASSVISASGVVTVQAELHYRNVRPPFYRAATGDATGLPPDVVIAQTNVE